MTLFVRPVLVTEMLSALGDLDDVLYADTSFMAVGLRKQVTLDSSNAVAAGFERRTSSGSAEPS